MRYRTIILPLAGFLILSLPLFRAASAGKWAGVDEAVVERFAADAGRHPVEPLINTDQGDLLLFAFLLAGTVGGFMGGYYWRAIVEGRRSPRVPDPPYQNGQKESA